jgi:hypothetical protein
VGSEWCLVFLAEGAGRAHGLALGIGHCRAVQLGVEQAACGVGLCCRDASCVSETVGIEIESG